jgi:hypothetical protein
MGGFALHTLLAFDWKFCGVRNKISEHHTVGKRPNQCIFDLTMESWEKKFALKERTLLYIFWLLK